MHHIDVTGIDNHEMTGLKMVNVTGLVRSHKGPIIMFMNQYTYHGLERSIHSSGQIKHYKNHVDDHSIQVGSRQCISTLDGYLIPLDIINGLPYLKMAAPNKQELADLPHIILTSPDSWNPHVLDYTLSDKQDLSPHLSDLDHGSIETPFDTFGNYHHWEPPQAVIDIGSITSRHDLDVFFHHVADLNARYITTEHETKPTKVNYEDYQPYFLHVPAEKV